MKGGFHGMSLLRVQKRGRGNESLGDPDPGHEAPMLRFGERIRTGERFPLPNAMGSHLQGANRTGKKVD